jgi:predicted Rossmann fold flavoprotein
VVGAGAAGLLAAIAAAGGRAPVLLIERTADGGRKILISGGGRCNVLPSVLAPERFVTDSPPRLMRGMLRAWPLPHMVRFFEDDVGVPLALEADTGKLFPRSNRARDVRDGLVALAERRGVSVRFHTRMEGLASVGAGWEIATTAGVIRASRVILATGGLSVPATGSDGLGLTLARTLGHRVHEPYAALTPLTFDADANPLNPHPAPRTLHPAPHPAPGTLHPAPLSGLSLAVRLRARSGGRTAETTGGFLFTHRGYSGPAVLDLSHVCVRSEAGPRAQLRVAWSATPAAEWEARLLEGGRSVAAVVAAELPERLGLALLASAGIPRDRRTSALTRAERLALVTELTACRLPWNGHEGYKKAEVTGGGIALDEVDPRTLESRRCPGLFFCGEILDAFGPIGGHNFAWAWVTGRTAGAAVAAAGRASIADCRLVIDD